MGLVLMGIEILAPGSFFIWFGLAALIVGLFTFALDGFAFWGWQAQWIAFVVLSLVAVVVGRNFMRKHARAEGDGDLINRRSDQLIGREAVVSEAIEGGYGRIKIDDTVWRVVGEDVPVGHRVRIVGQKNATLLEVEAR